LLALVDIRYFGAHNHLLNLTGVLFALLFAGLWSRIIAQEGELSRLQRALSIGLVWILIFWLGNRRVLGHGNESLHVFVLLVALFVGWSALTRCEEREGMRGLRAAVLAVLGCSIATLTFALGILTWPLLIGLAVSLGFCRKAVTLMLLVFAMQAATYAVAMSQAEGEDLSGPLNAFEVVTDAATWLGAPAFHALGRIPGAETDAILEIACPILGFVGMLLAINAIFFAWRKGKALKPLDGWCTVLLAFGLGSSLLIAMGRSAYFDTFPAQRVAPRYLTWTCVFWAAALIAVGLSASRLVHSRASAFPPSAFAAWAGGILLLPLALLPGHNGRDLESAKDQLQHAGVGISLHVRSEALAQRFFRRPDSVYRVARHLEQRNAAMFAWPIADQLGLPFASAYRLRPPIQVDASDPRLMPILDAEEPTLEFWGTVRSLPQGFVDFVVVDIRGTITGAGKIRGVGHRWARSIGLLARTDPRYMGYIVNFRPDGRYQVLAVNDEAEALPLAWIHGSAAAGSANSGW
jgi:hypothetical protein